MIDNLTFNLVQDMEELKQNCFSVLAITLHRFIARMLMLFISSNTLLIAGEVPIAIIALSVLNSVLFYHSKEGGVV